MQGICCFGALRSTAAHRVAFEWGEPNASIIAAINVAQSEPLIIAIFHHQSSAQCDVLADRYIPLTC
jgi:hypothetical protein